MKKQSQTKSLRLISPHTPYLVHFSYFRKGPFFGLACFANMPVESELERGARMKSVGILSPSYTLLYRYMHFLENQVRYVPDTRVRAGSGAAGWCPGVLVRPGPSGVRASAGVHASDGGLFVSANVPDGNSSCSSESWGRFCFQFTLTLSSMWSH